MAKKPKAPVPDDKVWVCEFCYRPHAGDDPPDECITCGNKYFDNFADMVAEKRGSVSRHPA